MQPHTDSAPARRAQRGDQSGERRAAALRKRKERARHKAGFHHYGMWLSDRAMEGLIRALILGQPQRLTPEQADRPAEVMRALVDFLEEEGNRWAR